MVKTFSENREGFLFLIYNEYKKLSREGVKGMSVKIPETAIDGDFATEMYDIDQFGIYQTVEYSRPNGTLYMRSKLSNPSGVRQYQNVTLSYFDETGTIHLYDVQWVLSYDINNTIVSRKKVT